MMTENDHAYLFIEQCRDPTKKVWVACCGGSRLLSLAQMRFRFQFLPGCAVLSLFYCIITESKNKVYLAHLNQMNIKP